MGGGDLNQKKSWHPQTLKNQEKVWKAEQAKNQELKRVNELRKEVEEERNREQLRRLGESSGAISKSDTDKKLEWMYKSSTDSINREEYLLGRSIDKAFEISEEEQKKKDSSLPGMKKPVNHVEHECIPFSLRDHRNLESNEQVDLQRKIMEDPLMLIKQREMESRRKILENPVKLKELHRILKTDRQLEINKKSKKSKKKKSKKKHKKRKKSSDSESSAGSSDDLDLKLAKKYKEMKGGILNEGTDGKNLSLTKLLDAKYETISKELDKAVKSKRKNNSGRRRSSSSESERYRKRRGSSRQRDRRESDKKADEKERRPRSHSASRRSSYGRSRDVERSRTRSPNYRQNNMPFQNHRQNSRKRISNSSPKHDSDSKTTNKLTEEEKETRRREMMENAAWRETDRTQAVKRHREAYSREESQNKSRQFDKNFINKEVRKAISNHSSVESRIRSNLNNIQRTSASMNSHFARK